MAGYQRERDVSVHESMIAPFPAYAESPQGRLRELEWRHGGGDMGGPHGLLG
jgi:hypothetical protein